MDQLILVVRCTTLQEQQRPTCTRDKLPDVLRNIMMHLNNKRMGGMIKCIVQCCSEYLSLSKFKFSILSKVVSMLPHMCKFSLEVAYFDTASKTGKSLGKDMLIGIILWRCMFVLNRSYNHSNA